MLKLSIENQKEIARRCGYSSFEKWRDDVKVADMLRKQELELKTKYEDESDYPNDLEIIITKRRIMNLKTNPHAISYWQRITDNIELTADEMIRGFEDYLVELEQKH